MVSCFPIKESVARSKIVLAFLPCLIFFALQALIQDFVEEGGWLVPKVFEARSGEKNFLGSSREVWGHAPPENF